jgi:hypothetical protein
MVCLTHMLYTTYKFAAEALRHAKTCWECSRQENVPPCRLVGGLRAVAMPRSVATLSSASLLCEVNSLSHVLSDESILPGATDTDTWDSVIV